MRRLGSRLSALVAAFALACTAGAAPAAVGLLEKLDPRYYATRIDLHVGPKQVLSRAEFMKPYSEETVLYLRTRGILDGYRGVDLAADEVVDRRSAAFLLGKFLQYAEARHGRIFPEAASDRIHTVLEPERWGHLQADLALRAGLMRPYKVSDWWRRPVSRHELAAIAGRSLQGLAGRLRIFRYNVGEPAAHYKDLHAYPTLAYRNLARSLKTGVVEGAGPDLFVGKEAIRGHEMARTLQRLLVIVAAYDPSA